jgi:cytochrome P450
LERALEAKSCDFLRDIASPVPLGVVCAVLGVPEQDSGVLRGWTDQLLTGFDSATATPEVLSRQEGCMQELLRYFEAQLQRRDHSQGTILSLLSNQPSDSSPGEALGLCLLMLVAGYETTIDLLGNGLFSLLRFPDQLQVLRREPTLLDSAIDEMLRFETPLQRTTFRVIREPIQIGGRQLEPGTQVAALLGAANRDETQFPDAERFDIRRNPNRHMAFGVGVHRCLGEKLARIEARIVFARVLERTSSLELEAARPRFRHTTMFRSLETLPIVLAPR